MNLLLASAAAFVLNQSPETQEMRLMRFPAVHGDTVVFTYAGDIWSTNLKGEQARRLTSHPNQEIRARISPDGKLIAFTGWYDGNPDVYVMPIDGGEPKRLTFEPDADNVIGWTPDGKIMYASTYGSFTNRQQRLWMVTPEGGLPIRTQVEEIFDGSLAADGKTLYYQRANSSVFNWRRYRGGTQGRVSVFDLATNQYRELPSERENSYAPMSVGNSVYYVSDKRLGTLNLYRYDLATKKDTQITSYSDADIKWPNTDGKTIVFERDGYLYAYDITSGKTNRLYSRVRGDNLAARPQLRNLSSDIANISLSPSGARLAVEARGELFSVPAKAGDTRNMTQSSLWRERFPAWSPDGKTIAFASDRDSQKQGFRIYTVPQLGGEPTLITPQGMPIASLQWSPDSKKIAFTTRSYELWMVDIESKKVTKVMASRYPDNVRFDWSPDSKWIAFINPAKNSFGQIFLYDISADKSTQVTSAQYDDSTVAFDQNGKYLYFTSNRTFQPSFGIYEFSLKVEDAARIYMIPLAKETGNPLTVASEEEPDGSKAGAAPASGPGGAPKADAMKVDFDRIDERAIVLPLPASGYRFILGANNGLFYWAGGTVSKFDIASRESQAIISGVAGQLDFNPSRTKLAYMAGGTLGVIDVRPGAQIGQGRVDTSNVAAVVNPRDEWKQMFWEAWRFERDNFYDQGLLGLNWNAIGDRYDNYLPYLAHRSDLNYILGLMIGELGTGHAYVSGGDMGQMPNPIPIGQLGVDYESANGKIRLKKIYRGANFEEGRRGPLGEPGVTVNDGEYLLAIDGRTLSGNDNPNELLLNKANKYVTLTVNAQPSMSGARQVRVRTISNEGNLRYTEWVEENRRYVEKVSGGRIGYMHVPDTAMAGAIAFIQGYWSQTDKDAMIVDERWNGGGYIQPWFVDTLARKARAGIFNRHGDQSTDAVAIEGPKAMLINQYAGSGGDFFPWMFRQAKLGPLIGKRTWGGLVGISAGAPLLDGGSVTSPEFGIYDRQNGEWIAENKGVDPDMDVDLRPDLVAQGKDPQLDAAIQHLMKELQKGGPRYKTPPFPKVVPPSGGGR